MSAAFGPESRGPDPCTQASLASGGLEGLAGLGQPLPTSQDHHPLVDYTTHKVTTTSQTDWIFAPARHSKHSKNTL